ncbi:P-loop containing nucleoside triphosphate hydrolase protein, partial [Cladochytrium replicatum]
LSHTVPKPPVHFIGREDILNKVHNHLVMHGAVILAAQGGMGKSSIALEYANQYKNTYDSIFWVPCNTVASAISAFQIYARSLFMTDNADTMPAENIVQLICGKFASLHRYLLILDNVDDESVL